MNPKPRTIARYGWRPDTPDIRDRRTTLELRQVARLPQSVDLLPHMPPIYDQGQLGSCTANAIAAAFEFELRKQALVDFTPSRLAIYYGERLIEHTVGTDAGAEIRDGMKVVNRTGVADEALWPYHIKQFAQKPPDSYFAAAKHHLCTAYQRVAQTEAAIKTELAAGYPIVFGISVYESFESKKVSRTGVVPMPKATETLLGGHALLLSAYEPLTGGFRNSWGPEWGKGGYGTLPLDYLLNPDLASDFWTIRIVE